MALIQTTKDYRDLQVWQLAHQFVLDVYRLTEAFPKSELFGLTSQLRRSAVSVPANIAEGYAKRSKADKSRYYNIAQGSLSESSYYLLLAQDLGYANTSELQSNLGSVSRMLAKYVSRVLSDN